MSKSLHELRVRDRLEAIEAALEADNAQPGGSRWTEVVHVPLLDMGAGTNFVWQAPAGKRARILAVLMNDFTEAIANSPTFQIGDAADPNEQVAEYTLADQAANTNDTTDRDAAVGHGLGTLVAGVLPVAPAAQLFLWTGTDPGTGTGIGSVNVVVEYFE